MLTRRLSAGELEAIASSSSSSSSFSSSSPHANPSNGRTLSNTVVGVLTGVAVFTFIIFSAGFAFLCYKRMNDMLRTRKEEKQDGETVFPKAAVRRGLSKVFDPSLHSIDIDVLRHATRNFDKARVIGDGGFGLVYNAFLPDGRQLAVKRLANDGCQGKREFQAEMETLGRIRHKNLTELLAYCEAGEDKVLVYEFMENGSLDMWLHEKDDGPQALQWQRRLHIAKGAAQGLSFLHHECKPHIIHRDIKSSNILLDANFEPKITDFGLARNMNASKSHVSTEVAGTIGYMAPECAMTFAATFKADVYSFGVLMLELVTGQRPNVFIKERNLRTLVRFAHTLLAEGAETQLLDFHLSKDGATSPPSEEVKQYLRIACECTQEIPLDRPTMKQVASLLDSIGLEEIKDSG